MVVIVGVVVVVVAVVAVVGFYFSNSSKSNSKSSIFKPCLALAMPWKPLLLNALAGPCRALNHSPSNSLLCALSSFPFACAFSALWWNPVFFTGYQGTRKAAKVLPTYT